MALTISSPAFANNDMIPMRYTCEGEDISPPLAFGGIPAGAASLALIVDDPDAPDPAAPKMTWVHWLVYNLDPAIAGLSEGVTELPPPAGSGRNDFGRTRYGGPCPPIGNHRYMFKLYALDTMLPDLGTPDKETLLRAMEGHILEKAVLIGRYQKQR
jgi:Raf kinase inhibitor-like YbhB/YbcL family protein